jgi:hypothetical protein
MTGKNTSYSVFHWALPSIFRKITSSLRRYDCICHPSMHTNHPGRRTSHISTSTDHAKVSRKKGDFQQSMFTTSHWLEKQLQDWLDSHDDHLMLPDNDNHGKFQISRGCIDPEYSMQADDNNCCYTC